MTQNKNPYEPSAITPQVETAARPSTAIGKPMATLVAVFACSLIAVVAGEILSVIALLPPLNHWLDLDGEFSGLILIGMPMLAGGCGALAGFVLGLLYPNWWPRPASAVVASLPAITFAIANYNPREAVALMSVSGIMLLATTIGILLTHRVLVSIEHRRSSLAATQKTGALSTPGRVVAVVAYVMALGSLVYDVWLWQSLLINKHSGQEFALIGALVLGILAVTLNVFVWAAYLHRKRVAIVAGVASFTGCVAVLTLWYLQLIG